MKSLMVVAFALLLAGCVTSPTQPVASLPPDKTSSSAGIENAKEFSGVVESWGSTARSSSTLAVWIQDIRNSNYVLFQIRVNLDTYRFALSRDDMARLIDALNSYEMIVRQTVGEKKQDIGWLYRANVKMKRMGEDSKDDRFIVNIERSEASAPALSITFDSWLLSFGGSTSPAERAYKSLALTPETANRLRNTLQEFTSQL